MKISCRNYVKFILRIHLLNFYIKKHCLLIEMALVSPTFRTKSYFACLGQTNILKFFNNFLLKKHYKFDKNLQN